MVRHALRVTCPTCVTHTQLDMSIEQSTPRGLDRLFELHQVPRTGAMLAGGSNSPPFHCDADLVRTALQPRLRIPFLGQDSQYPLCDHVLDRFCDHAAVCLCAGDRNFRHNAIAHVFYEAALEAGLRRRPTCRRLDSSWERHDS